MNYLKIYCNLIRKAENRTSPEGYTEKHHTFPISIFGKNNRVVLLSGREHYIAHALLEKAFIKRYGLKDKKTIKMMKCHLLMKDGKRYYNSYLYEFVRNRVRNTIKGENHHNYGKSHTKKHKNKISNSLKLRYSKDAHHMKGKTHLDETKRKIGEKNKNKYVSPETRKKHSEALKGIVRSDETKKKISQSKSGTKWWNNGQNCKLSIECPGNGWFLGRIKKSNEVI
jgi:hypothetical protein